MMKWIRWWGLGAFFVVVAVIALLWMVFVDGWVRRLIEAAGTQVVGAHVDLEEADLSLFPVGLTLTRLQVTNPHAPMTNAVEAARLAMGLDGLYLLQRKVIVEEMFMEGVRLNTPRTRSGAIKPVDERLPDEKSLLGVSLPSLEIPDVKTILQQEDLETMRLIEELKADLKQEKVLWETRLQDLPGKAQFANYQERVKRLKAAAKDGLEGMLGGVGEVQALKEEIERDVQVLKAARKDYEEKLTRLNRRLEQLQTAPQRDLQRLKAKYSLSPQGLANMSQTLLGAQIGAWVQQGVTWYERIEPFLEGAQAIRKRQTGPEVDRPVRGKGVDVHFPEAHPLPEFLIRLAKVSVQLDAGNVKGTVRNITSDQPTLRKPMTFDFSGDELKGVQSIALEGTLNHIVPSESKDHLTGQVTDYELSKVVLSKDDQWPVVLTQGRGDVTVHIKLNENILATRGAADVRDLRLTAGREGETNLLARTLSSAVEDISQLSLEVDVEGTLDRYEVELASNLDRIVQKAAGKIVGELAARFGGDLQSAISAKIAEPKKQLQDLLAEFRTAIGGDLGDRVGQLNEVLSSLREKNLPMKGLKQLPGGLKLPF